MGYLCLFLLVIGDSPILLLNSVMIDGDGVGRCCLLSECVGETCYCRRYLIEGSYYVR